MQESLYDWRFGEPGDVKWPYLSLKIPPHCPEIFKNTKYDINFQIITNEALLGKTKSRQGRKGRAGWIFSQPQTKNYFIIEVTSFLTAGLLIIAYHTMRGTIAYHWGVNAGRMAFKAVIFNIFTFHSICNFNKMMSKWLFLQNLKC